MARRARMFAALLGTSMLALMAAASGASASFHLMKIRAVFLGPSGDSFVELQMTAAGQTFVNGQTIDVYPNSGLLHSTFGLNHDVSNGANQSTILIGDNAALSPDFPTSGNLHTSLQGVSSAGALCYSSIDCVSWGSFTNNAVLPSPAGAPMSGLSTSQVAVRNIGAGCATALDAADDTNSSLADFGFAVGFPVRNNSTVPTEVPCPTPPTTPPPVAKKKCKKHKKKAGAQIAKKKCKKHKK